MNTIVIIALVLLVLAAVGFIFFAYSTSGQSSFTQANGTVASGAQKFSKLGTPWSAAVPMSCKGTVDCESYGNNKNGCDAVSCGWCIIATVPPTSYCCASSNVVLCSSKTTEASCNALSAHGCNWE